MFENCVKYFDYVGIAENRLADEACERFRDLVDEAGGVDTIHEMSFQAIGVVTRKSLLASTSKMQINNVLEK
jgi:hypothetical protein